MVRPFELARRALLRRLALGLALAPMTAGMRRPALAAEAGAPLLAVDSPEARAVKYVEDAHQAQGAAPGSTCANCGLYLGADGSAEGPCQLFPGRQVKAAGWCSSWAPQM
jgi:hypothetical protein